jgi:hypothetical protein
MANGSRRTRLAVAVAALLLPAGLLAGCSSTSSSTSSSSSGHVLLVGTYKGKKGQYTTIQAAVNAAKPGDWILVAPGDYKEDADLTATPANTNHGHFGAVLVSTPDIHIRGLNRNTVVVDGTKAGSPECSAKAADQQFGAVQGGKAIGRNGILIWKANDVSVQNLTTCNFLSGTGDGGNGVWWNGGADTAKIGLHGYSGSYLTATSTYFGGEDTAAAYGIFAQDAAGPASWSNIYGSNMNDSGMYVGACQQVCGVTIDKAWMEYNALGYSGTNSGGSIVIEHSLFDNNEDGLDTNTQINGDPPAPQNGACPNNSISAITHTHSCWVVMDSVFKSNNNPNTPQAGNAAQGPTGTGMTISGGKNDTIMHNTFEDNGAWGVFVLPYPDSSTPEMNQSCTGTGGIEMAAFGCVYDPQNVRVADNTFTNNGTFKNPTNGDIAQLVLNAGRLSNCFVGNTLTTTSPTDLVAKFHTCGVPLTQPSADTALLAQVLCDSGFTSCAANAVYPQPTGVVMHPLPKDLPTMPNPCQGVPNDAWCQNGQLS